ncbi:MAG: hypothetical protein MAG431_02482 [Chloroflexi bacterium]|nr:hypothetical protein [Chloroflexota bacterium]
MLTFNALAGLMAITASLVLAQARQWQRNRTTKPTNERTN